MYISISKTSETGSVTTSQNDTSIGSVQHTDAGPTVVHQITTFSEQSAVDDEVIAKITPSYSLNPYRDDTLSGFLERPRLVETATWNDSHPIGHRLLRTDVYFEMLTAKPIRNKLMNFTYIRAGARIGVRINGTPFHYGKLLVTWTPMFASLTSAQQSARDNLYTMSGYPHVIISPTENEVNEIVVPFAFPDVYMDLTQEQLITPGVIQVFVLNPLALDGNVPPISVSLFCNLENVELAGQSAHEDLPIHTAQPMFDSAYPTSALNQVFVAQGFSQRRNIAQEAKEKSTKGLISGPMKAVSAAAGALSVIPLVGTWSTAVAFVTGVLGDVAEKFGYCNPNTLESVAPRMLRLPNFAYAEGLDTSSKNQVIPENNVTSFVENLGGSEEEMQISSIVGTPSLMQVFSWTGGATANTNLYSAFVSPTICHVDSSTGWNQYFNTMLRWGTLPSTMWRGSLRYDVQITCSNFHSGRLRVSYQPKFKGLSLNRDDQQTINRIVDIQNETEFSFVVPYLSEMPWSKVEHWVTEFGNYDTNIGLLNFSVVNELTHTVEPIPDIHINVWVSAGPDFQLAYPSTRGLKVSGPPIAPIAFEAQGLTQYNMKNREHPPLLPGAHGAIETGICQVDTMTHVKQFTNRPCKNRTPLIQSNGDSVRLIDVKHIANPNESHNHDYVGWFSQIFAFSRGSYNVKLIPTIADFTYKPWVSLSNQLTSLVFDDIPVPATTKTENEGFQVFDMNYNPTLEVNVPYYGNNLGIVNGMSDNYFGQHVAVNLGVQHWKNTPPATVPEYSEYTLFRSTGDDFNFAYMVGPPATFQQR